MPKHTNPPAFSYADLDAQRLLAALDENRGGYVTFQTASGHHFAACGRDRQVLSLLIKRRMEGKGLSPRNKECPRNTGDALTHLTRDFGLIIGKRKITTKDKNAFHGKATLTYYHLLEDVRVVSDVHARREGALAEFGTGAGLSPQKAQGPFAPFLKSGSIKFESEIELHPQCQKYGHRGFAIQWVRDKQAIQDEAGGGPRLPVAERRRALGRIAQAEAHNRKNVVGRVSPQPRKAGGRR